MLGVVPSVRLMASIAIPKRHRRSPCCHWAGTVPDGLLWERKDSGRFGKSSAERPDRRRLPPLDLCRARRVK